MNTDRSSPIDPLPEPGAKNRLKKYFSDPVQIADIPIETPVVSQKDFDAAIEYLQQCFEVSPKSADIAFRIGRLYRGKNLETCLQWFLRAQTLLKPEEIELKKTLGILIPAIQKDLRRISLREEAACSSTECSGTLWRWVHFYLFPLATSTASRTFHPTSSSGWFFTDQKEENPMPNQARLRTRD